MHTLMIATIPASIALPILAGETAESNEVANVTITRLPLTSGTLPGTVLRNNCCYEVKETFTIDASEHPGVSALRVPVGSSVIIEIAQGCALTVKGGHGYGRIPGGAGIEVPVGAKLVVSGAGELFAYGGNAAKGRTGYGGLTITGVVTIYGGRFDIPAQIDGVAVVAIADGAFTNRSDITSVTIPDSVASIGDSAFLGCGKLDEMSVGIGLKYLGAQAFGTLAAPHRQAVVCRQDAEGRRRHRAFVRYRRKRHGRLGRQRGDLAGVQGRPQEKRRRMIFPSTAKQPKEKAQ